MRKRSISRRGKQQTKATPHEAVKVTTVVTMIRGALLTQRWRSSGLTRGLGMIYESCSLHATTL